jgi:hypothetical protein
MRMDIIFLSEYPAVCKVNGVLLGTIDNFERQITVDLAENFFVEILPGGEWQPLYFWCNLAFLKQPPLECDVFCDGESALIWIRRFFPKDQTQRILQQTKFGSFLITLFWQGKVMLAIDGVPYTLQELEPLFYHATFQQVLVANYPLLCVQGEGSLLFLSEQGKVVFLGRASSFTAGERLIVKTTLNSCAQLVEESTFTYNGEALTRVVHKITPTREINNELIPFAFFEALLYGGEIAHFCTQELAQNKAMLLPYLGSYTHVLVPFAPFYKRHPQSTAVGLAYQKGENVFEVKYFCVEMVNGKIDNIKQTE